MTPRIETPHKYVEYPENHPAFGSCLRCGLSRIVGNHAYGFVARINWTRLFSGHGWRN